MPPTSAGGRPPLYAVDGDNKLIESSTFASSFKPCPSDDFPKTFKTGDSVNSCLVYLVPTRASWSRSSFRPTDDFDPIIWVGEITEARAPKPEKPEKGKGDKNQNQGGNNN